MPDLHMFNYTFLQDGPPPGVAGLLPELRRQQNRLQVYKQEYPSIYGSLEQAAQVQALQSACGVHSMEGRAVEIAARNSPPINDAEKAMAGYRDALFELQLGHPPVTPCCLDLLRLHGLLLARSSEGPKGHWREQAAPGKMGPEEIPQAMEQWEEACQPLGATPPALELLLAPCLLLDFLRIAPFAPGEWRMSCLVARLLLGQAGMLLPVSWEEQARKYRSFFLAAMGQAGTCQGYWSFIECFLGVLYLCGRQAEKAFSLLPGQKMTKKARVEALVAGSPVPISKGEICKLLPDTSPTTVEAALGELVKAGLIQRLGSARTARYQRTAP